MNKLAGFKSEFEFSLENQRQALVLLYLSWKVLNPIEYRRYFTGLMLCCQVDLAGPGKM